MRQLGISAQLQEWVKQQCPAALNPQNTWKVEPRLIVTVKCIKTGAPFLVQPTRDQEIEITVTLPPPYNKGAGRPTIRVIFNGKAITKENERMELAGWTRTVTIKDNLPPLNPKQGVVNPPDLPEANGYAIDVMVAPVTLGTPVFLYGYARLPVYAPGTEP
jgi:hypothetical protein